jgi:hypothetical protein
MILFDDLFDVSCGVEPCMSVSVTGLFAQLADKIFAFRTWHSVLFKYQSSLHGVSRAAVFAVDLVSGP